jgi:hypothetical protein
VLCAGFTLLLGEDTPTSSLSGALVQSVTKLASITFLSLVLSPTGSIYLGFITEGRLAAVLITSSLGVPNWSVIYIINTAPSTSFLTPLPGRKKTSAWGVSHAQSFTLFLVLLYFIFACIFLSKIQKNSFLYSCFYLFAFSFARMGTPKNTKLCYFTSTKNNDFIYTPIAPPAPEAKNL